MAFCDIWAMWIAWVTAGVQEVSSAIKALTGKLPQEEIH